MKTKTPLRKQSINVQGAGRIGSGALLGKKEYSVTEYVVSVMELKLWTWMLGLKPEWKEHSRHYVEDDAKFLERHLRLSENKIARVQKVQTFYPAYQSPKGLFA